MEDEMASSPNATSRRPTVRHCTSTARTSSFIGCLINVQKLMPGSVAQRRRTVEFSLPIIGGGHNDGWMMTARPGTKATQGRSHRDRQGECRPHDLHGDQDATTPP